MHVQSCTAGARMIVDESIAFHDRMALEHCVESRKSKFGSTELGVFALPVMDLSPNVTATVALTVRIRGFHNVQPDCGDHV